MNAATFSQYDLFNGVTENVMMGQLGRLGTGMIDLRVDESKLHNAIEHHAGAGLDDDPMKYQGEEIAVSATPRGDLFTPFDNMATPGTEFYDYSALSPASGALTPAYATPGGALGYMSPYSPHSTGYASTSTGYVSKSPARSPAYPSYGGARFVIIIYFCLV